MRNFIMNSHQRLIFFGIFPKIVGVLLVVLFPTLLNAQFNQQFVGNWISHSVPKERLKNSDASIIYPYVYLKEGKVWTSILSQDSSNYRLPFNFTPSGFKQEMTMTGRKSFLKVADGYLVGFDHGEFGGSLYWFSDNGKQNYEISAHPVRHFVCFENEIYGIGGWQHMGIDAGFMVIISKSTGKWSVKKRARLPNCPSAIAIYNKNIIIVTTSGVISTDSSFNLSNLDTYSKWQPQILQSSPVITKNNLYIGMDNGVYRLNLTSGKSEWFLPR